MLIGAVVLIGTSEARAQGFHEHTVASGVDGPRSLFAEDIDGDGHVDIVSAAIDANEVAWYESDGAETPAFTEHVIATDLDAPRDVAAADLDGDGDMDILAVSLEEGNTAEGKVVWYENNGETPTPAFTPHEITNSARWARSVATADVNGSGHLDIIVAAAESSEVLWFENDGGDDPTFTEHVVTDEVPGVAMARPGDLDGDGDIDIAAVILEGREEVGIDGNRVVWYENQGANGDGTIDFAEHTIQSEVAGALAVYVADVNGDGALDVLSASKDDHTAAWYENDGNDTPSFTQHVLTDEAEDARWIHAADAEGDGDVDIFVASQLDNTVRAFANDGATSPTFEEVTVSDAVGGAMSVVAAPIDGDTKLDVVAAAGEGDAVLWFENDSNVLPVELVAFRGIVEGDEVVLQWRTLSETGNDGFAIERQKESGFEEIGYVRGAGTTSETQRYEYRTDAMEPGTHVFRLKQIDLDGTFTYSEEVEVAITMEGAFTLTSAYPNPFRNEARLDLRVRESQHVRVDVFNALGQRVKRLHDGPVAANDATSLVVDGDRLPSGTYLIRAVGEGFQETRSVTLVK